MGDKKIAATINPKTIVAEELMFMPNISVDCVILGFHERYLKVLLYKNKQSDKWMLPWGFVGKEEGVDDAALRVLSSRTGLENVYLKQFHLFGKKYNENTENTTATIKSLMLESETGNWNLQRFLSLGYYALVKYDSVLLKTDEDESTDWFDIQNLPALFSDHKEQIEAAVDAIKQQLGYIPIGFELLPEDFTMPELRSIYEAIIGKELDRRNFQRKMLASGIMIPLNETRKSGAHKSPNLYRFDEDKYEKARKYGLHLVVFKMK